jgi:formyltetrahydrofolate deformylase
MQNQESSTATLLISCPNRKGLVAAVSQFLFENGADITHADHHIDFEADIFFMRVEWKLSGFTLTPEETEEKFVDLAGKYQLEWQIHFSNRVKRVALFVSKQDHCLLDILWRYKAGEYPQTEFPLLISNHLDNGHVAKEYGMDFRHFPITPETKESQEKKEIALLRDYEIDLVVLARYMQILSGQFVEAFPRRIINIHHSFLPAFVGGNPYRKAYERGVKLVGATSHYVTEDLDEGPIIDQDVVRVSHRDTLDDLIRKGRDLEKQVLARAVRAHLQHNVLCYANKTVVFR